MEALFERCQKCTKCDLFKTRTNVVFGSGNEKADLMFIGEAAGENEDKFGTPFIGQAGKLLTNIIGAMGLSREKDVYICNVLKCRPPNNRNPKPEEVKECEGYMWEQLRIVRPKIVVALGTFAAQTLLESTESITKLRGKVHTTSSNPKYNVIATYHPAYLLRNLAAKDECWKDMQIVIDRIKNGN